MCVSFELASVTDVKMINQSQPYFFQIRYHILKNTADKLINKLSFEKGYRITYKFESILIKFIIWFFLYLPNTLNISSFKSQLKNPFIKLYPYKFNLKENFNIY